MQLSIMRTKLIFLLFAAALFGAPSFGQTDGGILERYQKPPTVLAPAHAPGMCLDFDTNKPWISTHLWECWPNWNQAFSFKGQNNQGQIWLGGYTCLTSQRGNGFRVVMQECSGKPEQQWTLKGSEIRDVEGRCLDASGAGKGNGTWVITYDCVKGATNQQWNFSSLRAEQKKAGNTGRGLAPGMALDRPAGYAQLSEFLERDRPRFTVRSLTSAERREIQQLIEPYSSIDVVRHIAFNGRPSWGNLGVPYSVIQRLMLLGETGDKFAMDSLLKVMRLALMIGESNQTSLGASRYDPKDSASAIGTDQSLAWIRLFQLTRVWSAHRWDRHGADRLAAFAFIQCYPAKDECGYAYDLDRTKEGGSLYEWAIQGDSDFYQEVTNIRFFPVDAGPAERLQRFTNLLGQLRWTYQGRNERISAQDYAWMAAFAKANGLADVYDNAWLITTMQDARHWHPSERVFDLAKWHIKHKADWEAEFALSNISAERQRVLLSNAKRLGNNYLLRYAQKYPLETLDEIQQICQLNSPDCQRQGQLYEGQRRRNAAFTAELEARRKAINSFGTGTLPSAAVTVRTYDRNGNYVGSTTTTRTDAELSGAKPR